MTPNAYELGETLWKYNRTQEYTRVRKFTCEKYGYRCLEFTEEQLVELGAVPVESKQIEKLKTPDTTQKHFLENYISDMQDKINEIIDHLQKG